jgi:hypothetical protein
MAAITKTKWQPYWLYGGLALAVLLPLLGSGYIFALDMSFAPTLRMPEEMSSSYLFHAGLHYLNFVIPSQVIQKIMLFAILLLSGLGMYRLIRHIQQTKNSVHPYDLWGAYLGGALYMINPFTYSRFMAGQYAVLLGYALLPFLVRALLQFLAVPTLKRAMICSGWTIIIGIVSVHTLGLVAVFALVALPVLAWRNRHNSAILKAIGSFGLMAALVFVAASGYWLFPLLGGTSNQGQAVTQFSASDQAAFATTGGGALGRLGNILQLQGFWAEEQGLYRLPQSVPFWPLAVLAVWGLTITGVVWLWKRQRAVTTLFVGTALVAITLAITGLNNGLPGLAGFREPHKFVGLVALMFALFAGLGAAAALARAKKRQGETVFTLVAVPILLLPILYTPTMYWGFGGQLMPKHYPADWFAMNNRLNQDSNDFRVLFLPWHLYTHFPFTQRVVVNPAGKFFDKPTIISNELEFKGAAPTYPDAGKKRLSALLPQAAEQDNLGRQLNDFDIKYVLLAKTFDHRDYDYLNRQTDLQLISETNNLKLYRNLAYEH